MSRSPSRRFRRRVSTLWQQPRRALPALAALLLAAGLAATAGPVQAATPAAAVRIVRLDEAKAVRVSDDATFYPTGPLDSTSVIVAPGVPVTMAAAKANAVDVAAPTALAASCWKSFAAPLLSGWSGTFQSYCYVIGHSGYTKTYLWAPQFGVNQHGCTQVLGYYVGYNGGTYGVWAKWYGGECGYSGDATHYVPVPWGNVAAYPKLRVKSLIPASTFTGVFQ